MAKIYSHPKKVFLILLSLTAFGIFSFTQLPVGLYPNSAKPEFSVRFGLEGMDPRDFLNQYGPSLKGSFNKLEGLETLKVKARKNAVRFNLYYEWGVDPKEVEKDLKAAISSAKGILPQELQRRVGHWQNKKNGGFIAISFYDDSGDLSTLQKRLSPILLPKVKAIKGVDEASLWDPNHKNLYITLDPQKIAQYRLPLAQLNNHIRSTINQWNAGSMQIGENVYTVVMRNKVVDFESLENLSLKGIGRESLRLKDIARVELAPQAEGNNVMRTDGKPSLILHVVPDGESNMKAICDSVIDLVHESASLYPKGTDFRVLVNPSTFIKSAIFNVKKDILLGGLFAVLTLLLFVGSIKASIFAAIEIPLAIVWAFILMYLFDVSINLISLGGLALTAGMNIDASVVMVENILRHFRIVNPKNKKEQLETVAKAAREVLIPILSSTLSTVIVFLPLSATSGITYAILGDLAKAVVFSHLFSLLVALVLVPTIRSHISMSEERVPGLLAGFQSFFDRVSGYYLKVLSGLISHKKYRLGLFIGFISAFVLVLTLLGPRIDKTIVAMPKTDGIWINVNIPGIKTTGQFSQKVRSVEKLLLDTQKKYVSFVFTNIWSANNGGMLVRIHDKHMIDDALKSIREVLPNGPDMSLSAWPWNPSSLPIPNPRDITIQITGPEKERVELAQQMRFDMRGSKKFSYIESTVVRGKQLKLEPRFEYIENLRKKGGPSTQDIGEYVRTLLSGRTVGYLSTKEGAKEIQVRFPSELILSADDISAAPIQAGQWLLPLKALVDIKSESYLMGLYEKSGREMTELEGNLKYEFKNDEEIDHLKGQLASLPHSDEIQILFTDAKKEINESLMGLLFALGISFLLIGLLLYLQFENLKSVAIVMCTIPLGLLGVTISLYVFGSTWSINSLLGVIMLGGISVNNSILLVSFFKQKLKDGLGTQAAALESAQLRLRPILVTSFTTIFAMAPIAFGFGEGAEVLQPLGIAVSGGMLFSTFLTLFFIPLLEVQFLSDRKEAHS